MSILQDLYDNAEHRFGSAIIRPAEVEEMVDNITEEIKIAIEDIENDETESALERLNNLRRELRQNMKEYLLRYILFNTEHSANIRYYTIQRMGLGNGSFICNNKPVCSRTNEKIIKMVYGKREEGEEMKTGDTVKVKEFLEHRVS